MSAAARVAVLGISLYQRAISPFLPRACRFAPSCSEYAKQVVATHGLPRGLLLSLWRLLRCQPFHPGGNDPPPPAPLRRGD